MSILSNKTEYNALVILSEIVRLYEQLHYLEMTAIDDFDATESRRLLERIIHSNGYQINYDKKYRKSILKLES